MGKWDKKIFCERCNKIMRSDKLKTHKCLSKYDSLPENVEPIYIDVH
jgi:hypothetical protein